MELTQYQLDLMKHTVSGANRNWFATNYNCKDSDEFEKLVEAGYATKQPAAKWMGDDVIYRLTRKGKEAIKTERN